MRIIIRLFVFIFFCSPVSAQQYLHGKVLRADTRGILIGATVSNISADKHNINDQAGHYNVIAKAEDKVVFSYIGYWSDTVIVTDFMLSGRWDIELHMKSASLQKVVVSSKYKQDSIERYEAYKHVLNHKSKIIGGNTPVGFGISISPVSCFSKRERQIRRFKTRFKLREEEYFIEYKFSKERVENATGLKGDSLLLFMNTYRPSYKFCRRASTEDILLYVSDKCREFKQKNN